MPVNPTDLSAMQTGVDAMRPPLTTIPDSTQTSKPFVEPESGFRNKVDRTPTKAKGKSSDTALPGRTPDKQGIGLSGRNRFGWAQKNEPNSVVPESRDDGSQMSRGAGFGNGVFPNTTPRSTRTVGKGTLNYSECNSTQSTPTKSVTKPPNPGLRSKIDGNGSVRSGNFAQLYKGIPVSCGPSTVVNTVEVPHFDLREDPSFWMDHNVQVLIRVRPPNSIERSMHGYNRCLKQESAQSITWIGQPEMRFTFDHVACETIDQETLFRMAGLPMVENCLSGYNSCMFAYGQTGSGKTHTMLGEIEELEVNPSPNRGMTPRIFEFLFARIRAEEESRRDERLKYFCKCSFLEIYNEQITDLLDPSSTNLLLREDIMKGVYVENLSEFEVQTVGDILRLLIQGSSNRKVAATNMNRESSRSHSVFTCVIESRWEKDSTTNLRFARLNLVDLAGSERQKTSGAEGERLKEAANINKSLSTLGHVIMVLLDVAHGKPRHVPYRDSRLTFLLQDSLGGNSKTMIIANVSPSICCSAETLNTLKFAQRAKLIQNNAVVNEDSSRDVVALQHEIRLLKEELSALKRQNVSRSLSFGSTTVGDTTHIQGNASTEKFPEDQQKVDDKCIVRMSSKQFKALETTLSGALRREQMAETSIKQLEAEIEQLNRLVRQREEDTRCTKMMLRFREEKIQRMESLLSGLIPADTYLLQENSALSEEILLLQAKVDRNPEVTRFALENIRLLDQLRRFQDFYEEGERDMLLTEVSELRHQLLQFLDGNSKPHNHPNFNSLPQEVVCVSKENDSLHLELKHTANELEECRRNLNSCLEDNAKLSREIDNLHSMLNNLQSAPHVPDDSMDVVMEESSVEDLSFEAYSLKAVKKEREEEKKEDLLKHTEELLHLQLELDVLKIILKEERSSRCEIEARALGLNRELELARQKVFSISKQCEEAKDELKDAKSVIEALESQQILSINEMENLRDSKSHYMELLSKQELEIFSLKEQLCCHELRDHPPSNHSESEDSPLQAKLKRMQNSLEKARRLNMWYQSDRAFQISNEEEMDEVHRQAEAETAAVIICLQEELTSLQQQVQDSNLKEIETKKNMMLLETEAKVLEEKLYHVTQDNKILGEKLEEKDEELRILSEEWEHLTCEIEEVLTNGHDALTDASHQVDLISSSFPHKRSWISEQVGRMIRIISEKELFIEELNRCLEDANNRRSDMENMLRSLKGAAMVITEAHQQECDAKEREILLLKSQLSAKASTIAKLENRIKLGEDQIQKASVCATVAFVIVNRLSEMNLNHVSALKQKNIQLSESEGMNLRKDDLLQDQVASIEKAEKMIQTLRVELEGSEESCGKLKVKLSEEKKRASVLEQKLEDIEEKEILTTQEKLAELQSGVSTLMSCMDDYADRVGSPMKIDTSRVSMSTNDSSERRTDTEPDEETNNIDVHSVADLKTDSSQCSFKFGKSVYHNDKKILDSRPCKDVHARDITIILLKKEIESALESLKGVQAEMAKLRVEKEEIWISEKQSRENMKCLMDQVLLLQSAMRNFEEQSGLKMVVFNDKLRKVEQIVQETGSHWFETKESLELEVGDAKIVAAQKTAEASCFLSKFEEAQDTMKEADIMINGLMIANETMKLEIERLKKERGSLISEVQSLQSSNDLKYQQYENLEKQVASDLTETRSMVLEMEGIFAEVHTTFNEDFMAIAHDFHSMKSQLLQCTRLIRSWLEDIWSELVVKDCAVSVLDLCHMGILLETVMGLNAENGLLHHGLCESNSVIAGLREHNFKTRQELEMCRILKGKLLADIKNSFDRISRKEEETGELRIKLTAFEKKILDLQLQEESMLHRSNYMGSELAVLMKELDLSNSNILASLLDQQKLLQDKDEVIKSQAESFMIDLYSKDIESLILASELEHMALQKAHMEMEQIEWCTVLESLKKATIFLKVDADLKEQYLVDKEGEVAILQKEVEEAHREKQDLLLKLYQSSSRIAEVDSVNKVLEEDIQYIKAVACSEQISWHAVLENLKKEMIFLKVDADLKEHCFADKEFEVALLQNEVEEVQRERQDLLSKLNQNSSRIAEVNAENKVLEQDIQLLKDVACTNDALKGELSELMEAKMRLMIQVQELEAEYRKVQEDLKIKETALECSSSQISVLDQQNQKLQNDISLLETSSCNLQEALDIKDAEISKMNLLEEENKLLKTEVMKLKTECCNVLQDLEERKSEFESIDMENHRLQDRVCSLETSIASLQTDLNMKNVELNELQLSQSVIKEDIGLKIQDLQTHVNQVHTLEEENIFLKGKLSSQEKIQYEILQMSSLKMVKCVDAVETVDMMGSRICNALDKQSTTIIDKMFQEICENLEKTSEFIEEVKCLECLAQKLVSENLSLQTELSRKDDVLKGLLFDLSLLQESASNSKDQKDEIEELAASLESLEQELAVRSGELDEAVARGQVFEAQLQEKIGIISNLELDISKGRESLKVLSLENQELRAYVEDALAAKSSIEEELTERRKVIDSLEADIFEMSNALGQMNDSIDSLKSNLSELTNERDHLQVEVLTLKEKLEKAQACADENEAIATEAQQIAESRKTYAEDKEEEVRLLERSVEELERTVNVLENKVDIVKGEAERQRLQREELELELHALKHQMQNVESSDADMKRHLDEKEKALQEASEHIKVLERDIANRVAEIAQLKAHISELNLHAEAQASEYKQKFKALEAMVEQVKPEGFSTHVQNSSSNKSEKNASKSRGSGSPFKCIGLGLVQQIKLEKDEELFAGRLRIEELEALAASRQKEIFALNARLAATESMTHDVIRDLLGLKLDMTKYTSVLDNQQVQKITEKAQLHSIESQAKEQEVIKLKQQLNEFVEERQGWLEEIDRKQAEMVAAQIALEKLRQRDQLLKTENEMLKLENVKHKKKVMELEGEVKKLSGQQNLQQRIHHHAKIKEENNLLKIENEDLSNKLRRAEVILSRVKEELARYRASCGRSIDFNEEQMLSNKLKETEEERLQLAQKFLNLCTSILKVAGITKPVSEISLSVAEEALEQLKNRLTTLERESQDLKFKNKIVNERIRLSELVPQPSPLSSRTDENRLTPQRVSQTPFLSALDR